MMKKYSRILIVMMSLFVMAPTPANACIAILAPVCDILTGGQILTAVAGRLTLKLNIMLSQLQMKAHQKVAEAMSANVQGISSRVATSNASRELPGPGAGSCAIASLGAGMLAGGGANLPTVNPAMNGGGVTPSNAINLSQTSRAPSTHDAQGNYVPNGKSLLDYSAKASGMSHEAMIAQMREDQAQTEMTRRNNLSPDSVNEAVDAKKQFDEHDKLYSTQTDTAFFNADINVQTIFDNDTFPPTLDQATKTVTMKDAADKFCRNLAEPTILPPNRGPIKAANTDRQMYSNERAGWDARLSLARSICDDAVLRRVPKDVMQSTDTGTDKSWFTTTVTNYRTIACKTKDNKVDATCEAAVNQYLTSTGDGVKISEYEQAKTIYTRMLFTNKVMEMLGAATDNDMLHMLAQLDQLQLALSYRMYEMQEKLNLIKAAQLATMVETSRTKPQSGAPN